MQRSIQSAILIVTIAIISITLQQTAQSMNNIGSGSHHSDNGVTDILNCYLEIKDALASDDAGQASEQGKKLQGVLDNTSVENNDVGEHFQSLKRYTDRIAGSSNLNMQRIALKGLTEAIIAVLNSTDTNEISLYVQYCPMALQDGAQWLSASEDIVNPYYGSAMLTCGENVRTVQ